MLIINLLLGIVLAGVGWWVKNVWQMVVQLSKDHNQQVLAFQAQITTLSLKLAEQYPSRAELDPKFEKLFDKLEEIQKEMRQR